MLIPYCKFLNSQLIWYYFDIDTNEIIQKYELAYCSIFRNKYSIFGIYIDYPEGKKIQYGVFDDNLNEIIPPIYSSLEFYLESDICFIGKLNLRTNSKLNSYHEEVVFCVDEKFWLIGKEIIPIFENIFVLVNEPSDILLFSIKGKLIDKFPFQISKEISNKSLILEFEKIEYCNDSFLIRYWTNGYEFEEYWETNYWLYFDVTGKLIGEGNDKDLFTSKFMKSGKMPSSINDLKWLPINIKPYSIIKIKETLLENSKLKNNFYIPFEINYLYRAFNGINYWEPNIIIEEKYCSVWDFIDFGQFKGERFIDIFYFNANYIEWLIKDSKLIFEDLFHFYGYGNPKKLNSNKLSEESKQLLINYLNNNNKPSIHGNYLLTLKNSRELLNLGILKVTDFDEYYYKFSEQIIQLNENKKV